MKNPIQKEIDRLLRRRIWTNIKLFFTRTGTYKWLRLVEEEQVITSQLRKLGIFY